MNLVHVVGSLGSGPLPWALAFMLIAIGLSVALPSLIRWGLRAVPVSPQVICEALGGLAERLAPRGLVLLVWNWLGGVPSIPFKEVVGFLFK